MGIRFRCHHCESELHVKDFQAGKRGRCPECAGRFRVPLQDAPHSLAPESPVPQPSPAQASAAGELARQLAPQPTAADDTALDSAAANVGQIVAPRTSRRPPSNAPTDDSADSPDRGQASPVRADAERPVDSPSAEPAQPQPAQTQPSQPLTSPPQPIWPRALQVATAGKWYVRPPSGGQYGPAASNTMWQWLNENRVGRDALVWTEGWPEWIIAATAFDDFFQAPAASMAADIPPPQPAAADAYSVAGQAPSESAGAPAAPIEPLLADRNRAERKQKRRRNYAIMIAALAVIMLLLIGTLVYVLSSQAATAAV